MRLTAEEFFVLTPRQFRALSERAKDSNERAELLMGIQTATLANHSFSPPKKPYSHFDFMPCKLMEKARSEPAPKKFNRQRFAQELRAMICGHPDTVHMKAGE